MTTTMMMTMTIYDNAVSQFRPTCPCWRTWGSPRRSASPGLQAKRFLPPSASYVVGEWVSNWWADVAVWEEKIRRARPMLVKGGRAHTEGPPLVPAVLH